MSIELVIVTPQGESFRGPVESVVLPGAEGEFEVLANHERFLCPLQVGTVEIKTTGGSQHAVIASGFADVSGHQVVVLVESAEAAGDIDVARAQLARDRASEGLAKLDRDAEAEREQAAEQRRASQRRSLVLLAELRQTDRKACCRGGGGGGYR